MENDKNIYALQLQDLIKILTERIEIYSAVISSADAHKDIDLIAFLEECMQLSQQFKSELNGVLAKEDTAFSEDTWTAGDLYARWTARKPSMEEVRPDQVIEACEKTENTILDIFHQILADVAGNFAENTVAMLKSQAALQQEIVEQITEARLTKNDNQQKS